MTESDKGNGLRPRFKLWLSTDDAEGVFGDGKWRLLESIGRSGSLSAAATELGISYRKAWGDLKKAERCLGVSLVEKHRGGISGGETALTDTGKAWLRAYSDLRKNVEKEALNAFKRYVINLERTET
ncbi:MAG: LysR family transcriptional regulator [Candidatus Coatesbacteria bacterium]|nr:LysR family transcriptional regulator [Candidatus Coatesbacteria bacterium]